MIRRVAYCRRQRQPYGTVTGSDATFTTAAPPTVALLNITAVSRSGNTLTVDFTGPPNTLPATWQVAGTSTLASFPETRQIEQFGNPILQSLSL
jgi:hypothetical protein